LGVLRNIGQERKKREKGSLERGRGKGKTFGERKHSGVDVIWVALEQGGPGKKGKEKPSG